MLYLIVIFFTIETMAHAGEIHPGWIAALVVSVTGLCDFIMRRATERQLRAVLSTINQESDSHARPDA